VPNPVSGLSREHAAAKVNLTLRVIGRRNDGYHELESLTVFTDAATLADALTFEPGDAWSLSVDGPFAAASGAAADNLVLKAAHALAREVPAVRPGRFSLTKNIPAAAGLGGGSADAAAALRLMAAVSGLASDDARIADTARALGADVPVCLASRARIVRGIGEQLSEPVVFERLPALLVNPRIALPTAEVFARFQPEDAVSPALGPLPRTRGVLAGWLAGYGNDLSAAAIRRAPEIAGVIETLKALPGCKLARMSGSGATCFALFLSDREAAAAAAALGRSQPDWWISPTSLG
jgi:4-diphosphocytidyl-2-C-methyl-D-erythritol kinase